MTDSCETCYFWRQRLCKRYPPVFASWPTDNQHPIIYQPSENFPATIEGDWCGEYRSKS